MRLTAVLLLAALSGIPDAAPAQPDRPIVPEAGTVQIETLAQGLEHPWALAVLPDGRFLITERPGRLRVVSRGGAIAEPVAGVPAVFAHGQGGLLDVALAPNFETSRLIYMSYAEPGANDTAGTAVARGRINTTLSAIENLEVIFRQEPKVSGGNHFGARLVFRRDGTLFVTLGERFRFAPAQDPRNHLGSIVRINPDGTPPRDNPRIDQHQARPETWSYGHRNIQAAALHPETGALWIAEMGPRGGDELNQPEGGKNYGWPLVSWGTHYDLTKIPEPPTRPDLAASVYHWIPSIAPSGMVIYSGSLFPHWRGSMLIGGLRAAAVVRVTMNGESVINEERIRIGARVRDVREGQDGSVYLLTDETRGKLLRLTPGGPRQ